MKTRTSALVAASPQYSGGRGGRGAAGQPKPAQVDQHGRLKQLLRAARVRAARISPARKARQFRGIATICATPPSGRAAARLGGSFSISVAAALSSTSKARSAACSSAGFVPAASRFRTWRRSRPARCAQRQGRRGRYFAAPPGATGCRRARPCRDRRRSVRSPGAQRRPSAPRGSRKCR